MLIRDYQQNELIKLNRFIQSIDEDRMNYHLRHIKLTRDYALLINRRLGNPVSSKKLSYAALSHDVLKEKTFDPSAPDREYNGHIIPSDIIKYVRSNLDTLEIYGMDEYFNSDVNWHPLAGGIFLHKELGVTDPEIIYPVIFHSCPIMAVYETLPYNIRTMVDIIMLADKLSSNYIRINYRESNVAVDLDAVVFGTNGKQFQYDIGLLVARLINETKIEGDQVKITNDHYLNRVLENNPWIKIGKIGGNKKWPKRKSLAFLT